MTEQPDAAPEQPAAERPILVTQSADRLSAFVSVRPGATAGAADLRRALARAGVSAGIDDSLLGVLAERLRDPAFESEAVLVAQGVAARPGTPGHFESTFVVGLQPGRLRDDGTLDFHDRELLKPVEQGDLLGRIFPAVAGAPGFLVDGSVEEPAAMTDIALSLGPGAELAANGLVRAARSGVVVCKNATSIDVVDQMVHEGPVDLRSGHLHMRGSLLVKGDVTSSFRVYASGDVEIRGGVDNAAVYAGGSLKIEGGVRGSSGVVVCAEGNVSVHHAEFATVRAGHVLRAGEAVHANLSAERVEVSGRLRGGVTRAETGILVREAGSVQGVQTELETGEPLELPVEFAQRALEHAKAVREARPVSNAARGGRSERSRGDKFGRVQAALDATELTRLAERARRRAELAGVAFIQAGAVHPGVIVRIGDKKLLVEHALGACRFTLDRNTGELRMDKVQS